jgi:hypothetical protein
MTILDVKDKQVIKMNGCASGDDTG